MLNQALDDRFCANSLRGTEEAVMELNRCCVSINPQVGKKSILNYSSMFIRNTQSKYFEVAVRCVFLHPSYCVNNSTTTYTLLHRDADERCFL